jgi:uncharacterized membrane protein YkoI
MNKNIPLLLCACFSLWANVTLAQSVAQPGAISGDISAFHGNQSTLVNAIQAVQQSTGGKVLDIRWSNVNGVAGYNAVVLKAAQVQFFHLEERSRHVIELDASSKPVYMLNWRGKADVSAAKQAPVSLSNAIQTAQQSQNSPALAAGIARSASNPESDVHAYTVLLNVNGGVKSVSIDSSTGQIISDPSALSF